MLQVSDSHERLVEVVKLQNTGQQEEARDENTTEELRQSKRLQTNCCQPKDDRRTYINIPYISYVAYMFNYYTEGTQGTNSLLLP